MTDLQICLFALGNCMAGMMIALAWLSQNRLGVTLAHGFFIIMWAVVFGFGGVDPLRAEEALVGLAERPSAEGKRLI